MSDMVVRRSLIFALAAVAAFGAASSATEPPLVIKAAALHVGNGQIIDHGMVLIEAGRISKAGADVAVPMGAKVIEIEKGEITPGLIDAHAQLDISHRTVFTDTRDARHVATDLFVSHKGHKHGPGIDCCGSSCPLSMQHVDGSKCAVCGFPEMAPSFAVGTQFSLSGLETSSEVIPHTRVIDSIDLRSGDFDRLVQDGVTTVYVAPDPGAVISSQGAIVRTGGTSQDRMVHEADAIMAAMGTDPSWRGWSNRRPWRDNVSFYARRPTTRMGVAWVFRKALYDTKRSLAGQPISGADAPSEPAMRVLAKVLSGDIPLRIQARMQHDILTALRLAEEFGLRFTLVEATEAYRCTEELKATGTPVIYGPIYVTPPGARAGTAEVDRARLHTLETLLAAGIPTALTAGELRDEDGLSRQAMYAHRFGLSIEQVTRAVTETPATILGLSEVGTLETGKRADLVVWSGAPFDGTSRPLIVLIGGDVVLDKRPS